MEGCWGLLGWLLLVMKWIIPENSLRLSVRLPFRKYTPFSYTSTRKTASRSWLGRALAAVFAQQSLGQPEWSGFFEGNIHRKSGCLPSKCDVIYIYTWNQCFYMFLPSKLFFCNLLFLFIPVQWILWAVAKNTGQLQQIISTVISYWIIMRMVDD